MFTIFSSSQSSFKHFYRVSPVLPNSGVILPAQFQTGWSLLSCRHQYTVSFRNHLNTQTCKICKTAAAFRTRRKYFKIFDINESVMGKR